MGTRQAKYLLLPCCGKPVLFGKLFQRWLDTACQRLPLVTCGSPLAFAPKEHVCCPYIISSGARSKPQVQQVVFETCRAILGMVPLSSTTFLYRESCRVALAAPTTTITALGAPTHLSAWACVKKPNPPRLVGMLGNPGGLGPVPRNTQRRAPCRFTRRVHIAIRPHWVSLF